MLEHIKSRTDRITYNGITFTRYIDSAKNFKYYTPHSGHVKKGISNLHRYKYLCEIGDIPDGYDIHHKDGNYLNNDVSNLEAVESGVHISQHSKKWHVKNKERVVKHLDEVRDLTKKWHGSKEGYKWHSEHAIKHSFGKHEGMFRICKYCGKIYKDQNTTQLFCAAKCSSAYRRREGTDNVTRICVKCGTSFVVNKYAKTKFCSKSCGISSSWASKRELKAKNEGGVNC